MAATGGDAFIDAGPIPHFVWEDQGKSRKRLSWQTSLRWPLALVYDQIDPAASYVVRLNGPGEIKLKIDDEPVEPVSVQQDARRAEGISRARGGASPIGKSC